MGTGVRLFLAEPGSNCGVGGFDGKRLGIEVAADPLSPLGVFGMSRVGQDGQQFLIARWPPAINFLRAVGPEGKRAKDPPPEPVLPGSCGSPAGWGSSAVGPFRSRIEHRRRAWHPTAIGSS
jgi:hypothetical protein